MIPEQKKISTIQNVNSVDKVVTENAQVTDKLKDRNDVINKKISNEKIIVESKQSLKMNQLSHHNAKDNDDDYRESNGVITNGLNKRISKQKWVPLNIDLSKGRPKRGGSTQRRRFNTDYDENDWRSGERGVRATRRPIRGSSSSSSTYRGRGGSVRGSSSRTTRRPPAPKSVNNDNVSSKSNNSDYADYSGDFSAINKLGVDAPAFMMPYLGTYYCGGTQNFAGVNTVGVKDCIKKQM